MPRWRSKRNMRLVIGDFETFYSKEYTLSKMTTESYVRDHRFEPHGGAIKWSVDTPARWYNPQQTKWILQNEDWADTLFVAHHCNFDGLILSNYYDVHPARLGCTLSMARMVLGNHISVSLDSVRKHFELPPKSTPYNLMIGRHWHEMPPETQEMVAAGACDEVESIWKIFHYLLPLIPVEELNIIDTTIKMFTEPLLCADSELLAQIWESEDKKKFQRQAALGVTPGELQSADRFADLLRAEGVEIEYKPGKSGQIPCFAKTDPFMRDFLLEHENDRIRGLAEARIGQKSTLMQTRAETLGWMASRGPLCVYLRHAGAGTLRVSGGDGANWLNFKRQSLIRKAILAPDGFELAPVDSSQIECRVAHYLAGGPGEPIVELFRRGEDPYVGIASQFYGERIYKPEKNDPRHDEMEAKRGMGKQSRLMCQYGAAAEKFKQTAKNGLYGPPVDIPIEEAARFVALYRSTTPSICARGEGLWAQCNWILQKLVENATVDWNEFCRFKIRDKKIYLPTGHWLIYDTLEFHVPHADEDCRDFERNGYYRLRTRDGWKTMWGSKLVQNLCEAVSRVIVSQAMIRITKQGYRVLNWPYDELLVLLPKDGRREEHVGRLMTEMKREPQWLPDIPLDAECVVGDRYAK